MDQELGRVKTLNRYPVKGFAGEAIKRVYVSYSGLIGDRVYALVDPAGQSTFPFVSARNKHNLILLKPKFKKELFTQIGLKLFYPDKDRFDLDVTTTDGQKFNVADPAFLSYLEKLLGIPVELKFSERGFKDSRPVSILGTSSITALEQELGKEVAPERFRMNFIIEWHANQGFFEDTLLGKTIRIGSKLELQIAKKDKRCIVTTLDPTSGESDPSILTTIAQNHENCFGVYAIVVREGIVCRNDLVWLVD